MISKNIGTTLPITFIYDEFVHYIHGKVCRYHVFNIIAQYVWKSMSQRCNADFASVLSSILSSCKTDDQILYVWTSLKSFFSGLQIYLLLCESIFSSLTILLHKSFFLVLIYQLVCKFCPSLMVFKFADKV